MGKIKEHVRFLLGEAEKKPSLEKDLKDTIEESLGSNIDVDSYSEDGDSIEMYFYLPLESNNLYFQLEYSENTMSLFLIADPKTKAQQGSMDTANAIYSRPMPLLGNERIPDKIKEIAVLADTTLKMKIREYLS